jgi:hypothetical protein
MVGVKGVKYSIRFKSTSGSNNNCGACSNRKIAGSNGFIRIYSKDGAVTDGNRTGIGSE